MNVISSTQFQLRVGSQNPNALYKNSILVGNGQKSSSNTSPHNSFIQRITSQANGPKYVHSQGNFSRTRSHLSISNGRTVQPVQSFNRNGIFEARGRKESPHLFSHNSTNMANNNRHKQYNSDSKDFCLQQSPQQNQLSHHRFQHGRPKQTRDDAQKYQTQVIALRRMLDQKQKELICLRQKQRKFQRDSQLFKFMEKSLQEAMMQNERIKGQLNESAKKIMASQTLIKELEDKIINMSDSVLKLSKSSIASSRNNTKKRLETISECSDDERSNDRNSGVNCHECHQFGRSALTEGDKREQWGMYLKCIGQILGVQGQNSCETLFERAKQEIARLQSINLETKCPQHCSMVLSLNSSVKEAATSRVYYLQNIEAEYREILEIFNVSIEDENHHERLLVEINEFRENIKAVLHSFQSSLFHSFNSETGKQKNVFANITNSPIISSFNQHKANKLTQ